MRVMRVVEMCQKKRELTGNCLKISNKAFVR